MYYPFGYPNAPMYNPAFPQAPHPLLQYLPQQQGKTQYKYHTPDGGVPSEGKVPSGSAFDPPKPPQPSFFPMMQGNCVPGAVHPFPFPNIIPGPVNFCGPPPPYGPPPCAPVYQWGAATPAPTPAYYVPQGLGAAQYSAPGQEFHSTGKQPPVSGNRVKGQLPKFDNGMGHIFHKDNLLLHVFTDNVVTKHARTRGDANQGGSRIRFMKDQEEWTPQTVACDMTFRELIEQLDCVDRANQHPPYNVRGQGYPEHLIGIQELLDMGDGSYVLGTAITMDSCQADSKLRELWPETTGSAGGQKPRLIVRFPI